MVDKIKNILSERGASFSSSQEVNLTVASKRADLAKLIGNSFELFDEIRVILADKKLSKNGGYHPTSQSHKRLINLLEQYGYVEQVGHDEGYSFLKSNTDRRRFMTGGWLEELAYHAVLEAGADAAVFGQKLDWVVGDYSGKNEVDVIARKGERLIFVSCKCAKAILHPAKTGTGKTQRYQLRRALDEADNWVDHFGDISRDDVVLLVTTDLINEASDNKVRYAALFGKAKALDVEMISLDSLRWTDLVSKFHKILSG